MPNVFIPTPMRKFTNNRSCVQVPAGAVVDILDQLEGLCPGIRQQLCDPAGEIKRYINVFVNGDEIRTLQGQATTVGDRDEIYIVPAMAGG